MLGGGVLGRSFFLCLFSLQLPHLFLPVHRGATETVLLGLVRVWISFCQSVKESTEKKRETQRERERRLKRAFLRRRRSSKFSVFGFRSLSFSFFSRFESESEEKRTLSLSLSPPLFRSRWQIHLLCCCARSPSSRPSTRSRPTSSGASAKRRLMAILRLLLRPTLRAPGRRSRACPLRASWRTRAEHVSS